MTAAGVARSPAAGLLRAVAGVGQRTFGGRLRRSLPYRLLIGGPSPTRILAKPPLVLEGDPEIAAALYRGRFDFAGQHCDIGAHNPFATIPPSSRWFEALVGFDWLRHLSADGSAIAAAHARACVADWIDQQGRGHADAWRPPIVARRVTAWLASADMIVHGADQVFFDAFIGSLGRQLRFLVSTVDSVALARSRLAVRAAVVQACLCLDDCDKLLARETHRLLGEIGAQILPDGGHLDRNPRTLVELLPDLVRLRETFVLRDIEAPQGLVSAIERMLPMLRLFLHGDSGLALFNGAVSTAEAEIAAIFAADATRGRPLAQARHSGYQRVVHKATTLLLDAGLPPPPGYSGAAHAGCLAFELSHARHRIIVNCGSPDGEDCDWAAVARTTAAHSTATVNDSPSGRIRDGWLTRRLYAGPVLVGPRTVELEREDSSAGTIIEAGHDGYERSFGLIHSRRLYLASDGNDLRGEDGFTRVARRFRLGGAGPDRYAIRFHLHPTVRATASKDGDTILLLLPNHVGWRFTAAGGAVGLEESVYLGDGGQPRRTQQIVVHGTIGETAVVKWALKRHSRNQAGAGSGEEAPTLPFEG